MSRSLRCKVEADSGEGAACHLDSAGVRDWLQWLSRNSRSWPAKPTVLCVQRFRLQFRWTIEGPRGRAHDSSCFSACFHICVERCSALWNGGPCAGIRVGEAAHPGPERQGPEALLGTGLLEQIKGAIQKLVAQAVRQSLGQAGLPAGNAKANKRRKRKVKKAAAKKGGGGGTSSQAPSPSTAPAPATDKDKGKGKGKGQGKGQGKGKPHLPVWPKRMTGGR